jgi:hypothetical protein
MKLIDKLGFGLLILMIITVSEVQLVGNEAKLTLDNLASNTLQFKVF